MNDDSHSNNNFLRSGARPKVRNNQNANNTNFRIGGDQVESMQGINFQTGIKTHQAECKTDLQMPEIILPQKINFGLGDQGWKPEAPAGLDLTGVTPLEQGYCVSGTEFTGKVRRKKSRLHCRRGAVVLHKSPVGHDLQGERKLRIAAQQGNYDEIQNLLQNGINPNRADERGRTALHFAVTKGHKEIVQLLLDGGSDVNQKDSLGNTPLHLASITAKVDIVTALLESGADCHDVDRSGHTPIHLAHSLLRHMKGSFSDKSRQEVFKLIGMLRLYMSVTGRQEHVPRLDDISERMNNNNSEQPIDEIQDILNSFTNLHLQGQK